MKTTRLIISSCCAAALLLAAAYATVSLAATATEKTVNPPPPSTAGEAEKRDREPAAAREEEPPEPTAMIAPYRSAEISAEARGIIDTFPFKEGDFVKKDEVVVVISKRRYILDLQRATNKVKAAEADMKRAKREAQLREQLLSEKATTTAELLRARAEEELAEYRVEEAKNALEIARLDLEACQVKAPFNGYIAVRHKEPFESVDYFQRIFVIVDSSKVYAIGSISESQISQFTKGRGVVFVPAPSPEKRFTGTVERVGMLRDPKSGTKKVYVVIDNSDGRLEIGMPGYLGLAK
jgi:RND family efflux transporter MFP subunit